jgi:SAM-dependent methyltransferase
MPSLRSSALKHRHADDAPIMQPPAGPEALDSHIGGVEGQRYRRYQFDLIEPYVGRSLLEIGSGLGTFSEQFLDRLDYLAVSDNDAYCLDQLAARYAGHSDVDVLDLTLPCQVKIRRQVDSIVMMNVLEHIADDGRALRDLAACLEPAGHLIIWVPGYQSLYGDFDRRFGHYRRYTPETLRAVVVAAGLTPQVCKPVNFLGGIAWWLAVKRFGVGHARRGLVSLYDTTVVPVTRILERAFHPPFGQSVLCVARLPQG